MTAETKYYLGGSKLTSVGAIMLYYYERGNGVYYGNSSSWIVKIALMYPSDNYYTYSLGVDNTCYTNVGYRACDNSLGRTNSWIYNTSGISFQWLLTPNSENSTETSVLNKLGDLGNGNYVDNPYYVRPTLYLKPSVKITSGDGSKQSPYQLSL